MYHLLIARGEEQFRMSWLLSPLGTIVSLSNSSQWQIELPLCRLKSTDSFIYIQLIGTNFKCDKNLTSLDFSFLD